MISRNKLLEVCSGRCAYCGKKINLFNMQVDYVLPIQLGGTKTTDNALPACRECKEKKGSGSLEGFRTLLSLRTGKALGFILRYGGIIESRFI